MSPHEAFTFDPTQKRGPDGRWARVGGDLGSIAEGNWSTGRFPEIKHNSEAEYRPPGGLRDKLRAGKRRQATKEFTLDAFQDVNGPLREGGQLTGRPKEIHDTLRESMVPTPRDTRVHRLVTTHAFGVNTWEQLKDLVGKELEEPGFTSTSANQVRSLSHLTDSHPDDRLHLNINVPKGTRALHLHEDSSFNGEAELLLDTGTRYRVDRVYRVRGQQGVQVDMTVMGQQ